MKDDAICQVKSMSNILVEMDVSILKFCLGSVNHVVEWFLSTIINANGYIKLSFHKNVFFLILCSRSIRKMDNNEIAVVKNS